MNLEELHIEIVRKAIRRLHLRVYSDGRVVASVPWITPRAEIEAFVRKQEEWIIRTRERVMNNPPQPLPTISKEQAEELRTYLTEAVERWRIKMGEEPVTWRLRNMKTQWGNCRAIKRVVTFNLQLARVPNDLRDYIIVHELSHLKIQNHGPLFKARETLFMPDWQERRKRLQMYQ